jgi:hypothetical protein
VSEDISMPKEESRKSVVSEHLSMPKSSTKVSVAGPATGANVTLDENGYTIIEGQCCNWEMQEFIKRVIYHNGLKICNEYALRGFVPW